MAQDISTNSGSGVTNTNTMNPRNFSAASAGSVSPTIISQRNQDRRRQQAAEREERRRQSLAENVERAEVEREYRQLRAEEEAANRRAEERKEGAKKQTLKFWSGGYLIPSEKRYVPVETTTVSIYDYLNGKLQGAQAPVQTPEELRQYQTIGRTGGAGADTSTAYRGLQSLAGSVNNLLDTEAKEKRAIANAKLTEQLAKDSFFGRTPSYTPMSEEAVAAHYRIATDPNTDPETRQAMINDLKMDSEYVASHGGAQLSASHEQYLSEEIYRGGSQVSPELKRTAGAYLAAAGSRYDVASSNRSVDNRFATQLRQSEGELQQRYKGSSEINNPDNTPETTAALRANQEGARQVLDTLYKSGGDTEKQRFETAQERRYAAQDSALQEYLRTNPIEDNSRYVESILRVSDDRQIDLSSDAFFREQGRTERIYGSDWASAGGETAEDAAAAGRRSTGYSSFKGTEGGEEFFLVDAEGKRRYTLKLGGAAGGFAIYGWSGDLVGSGQSTQGLAGALKNLGIPFDEREFNPARPDADSTLVELQPETDISGINTAAAFRAATLGTLRSNEEIIAADDSRRAAEKSAQDAEALRRLDESMTEELGHTIRIGGDAQDVSRLIQTPGMYVREGAENKAQVRSSDITMVSDPAVDNALKSAGDLLQRVSPVAAVAGAVTRTDSKRIEGADTGEPDFIVTQNEGSLAELSDMLISGSEQLGSANDAFNSWVKDLTGRKLIETEYGALEKSWADIAGDLSGGPLQFGFKIAGENLAKGLGFDAEPDLMTETRRSVNRQVIEAPLYAGSLIKIADSIASSGAEGGLPAAAAAAGFWGTRAGEGLVSEAVTNPRKLTADLTAGLAVGTLTTAAVRPLAIVGKKVGIKTGEFTGIVNTDLDPVGKVKGNSNRLSVIQRPTTSIDTLGKGKISGAIHYQRYDFDGNLYFPTNTDPFFDINKIDSKARAFQWVSTNPHADKTPINERSTLRGSQEIFTRQKDGASGGDGGKAAIVYQNIERLGNYIPEDKRLKFIEKFKNDADFTQEEITYMYDLAQHVAWKEGVFVAAPAPKSLKQFRGAPENEAVIFSPYSKEMIKDVVDEGGSDFIIQAPNYKFGGWDKYGTPIYIVDTAKGAKQGKIHNPLFMVENAKNTLKDLRFHPKYGLYYQSRARYDANIGKETFYDNLKRSPNYFAKFAYGKHNWEHFENVELNMENQVKGSQNPEIQKVSKKWRFLTAHMHDINKLWDKDMIREHGKRTSMLIDIGMYDDIFKKYNANTPKFKKSVSSAISKHTFANNNIFSRIRYRPSPKDMLLINADRLDLTRRYNIKPDPKRMFIHEVMDEPWSWTRGELLPQSPKKGSYTMFENSNPNTDKLKNLDVKSYREDINSVGVYDYPKTDTRSLFGAGVLGGSSFTPRDKKQTDSKKRDNKSDYDIYRDYRRDTNYYSKVRDYPKIRDYKIGNYTNKVFSDYNYQKDTKYSVFHNYPSKYVIQNKKYNVKGYSDSYPTKSSAYIMGSKYKLNPYQVTGGYKVLYNAPAKKELVPKQNRLRKNKKDKVLEMNFNKIKLENVEIPIVRPEEVLFSKDIGVLELPARKQTLYEFGNILTTKKPNIRKKKRR